MLPDQIHRSVARAGDVAIPSIRPKPLGGVTAVHEADRPALSSAGFWSSRYTVRAAASSGLVGSPTPSMSTYAYFPLTGDGCNASGRPTAGSPRSTATNALFGPPPDFGVASVVISTCGW